MDAIIKRPSIKLCFLFGHKSEFKIKSKQLKYIFRCLRCHNLCTQAGFGWYENC